MFPLMFPYDSGELVGHVQVDLLNRASNRSCIHLRICEMCLVWLWIILQKNQRTQLLNGLQA